MKKYTLEERIAAFWAKVDKSAGEDGCWNWTGSLVDGYGNMRWGNPCVKTHRISYLLAHDSIPDGLFVLHSCDNRRCVNPSHLHLGTNQDNMDEMNSRGRAVHQVGDQHWSRIHPELTKKGSRHGCAKLTEADVIRIRERVASGEISQYAIAREYGVDKTTISLIALRRSWKHV